MPDSRKPELKPCPMCGNEPTVERSAEGMTLISCTVRRTHVVWTDGWTLAFASRRWNRRAKP